MIGWDYHYIDPVGVGYRIRVMLKQMSAFQSWGFEVLLTLDMARRLASEYPPGLSPVNIDGIEEVHTVTRIGTMFSQNGPLPIYVHGGFDLNSVSIGTTGVYSAFEGKAFSQEEL